MDIPENWPKTGFIKLNQIIGDPDADPPIPAVIPVSEPTWHRGVKAGKYPAPIKHTSKCSFYSVPKVIALLERIEREGNEPKAA